MVTAQELLRQEIVICKLLEGTLNRVFLVCISWFPKPHLLIKARRYQPSVRLPGRDRIDTSVDMMAANVRHGIA